MKSLINIELISVAKLEPNVNGVAAAVLKVATPPDTDQNGPKLLIVPSVVMVLVARPLPTGFSIPNPAVRVPFVTSNRPVTSLE